ncbi:hypothetical protein CspHIS471_0401680 [Cutaneotrichosporon sp. HIS471]|nr:hypothetical protein CspHIS471_0401680 [Cutaneotrichosporon sp. HIS471]
MLGPVRFTHIATVAHTSSKELVGMLRRRELRSVLVGLDCEISDLRKTIAGSKPPQGEEEGKAPAPPSYDDIDDIERLQRLVKAREMTQNSLEKRVGWAALEQTKLPEEE